MGVTVARGGGSGGAGNMFSAKKGAVSRVNI